MTNSTTPSLQADLESARQKLLTGRVQARRNALESLLALKEPGWQVLQDYLLAYDRNGTDWLAGSIYRHLGVIDSAAVQQFLLQTFPQGLLNAVSEQGIDYRPLEQLLINADFEAADRLTIQLLCQLAGEGAVQRKWLYFSEVDRVPLADLQTLDRLWLTYSEGKFGYSVQREIWLSVGQVWEQLWLQIGWKAGNLWTRYPNEFTWNLAAPRGHLPLSNQLRGVRVMASILNHPAITQDTD